MKRYDGIEGGLPLHIGRRIRPATFQRNDVIDYVTRPALGIAGLLHEIVFGYRTSGDFAIRIACGNG